MVDHALKHPGIRMTELLEIDGDHMEKELPDENNNDEEKISHGDGQETDLKDNRDDDRK